MTTTQLIARIETYADIDPMAVDDCIRFVRIANKLEHGDVLPHCKSISESIDVFADLDRALYRALVRRWNATAPVYAVG